MALIQWSQCFQYVSGSGAGGGGVTFWLTTEECQKYLHGEAYAGD